MESANKRVPQLFDTKIGQTDPDSDVQVRVATAADLDLVDALLRNGTYRHRHVDWFEIKEWMGEPTFLISENRHGNRGALVIAPDDPPAAWVRLIAVNRVHGSQHQTFLQLAEMFNRAEPHIKAQGIRGIGWMSHLRWVDKWAPKLGFRIISTMVTYTKKRKGAKFDLPPIRLDSAASDLFIRPAFPEDMTALAKIEAETYDPIWRHSGRSLHFAWRESLSFDVALVNQRLVGFQHSTRHKETAHLARLTVSPQFQGLGIGSALLRRAIQQYERVNISQVTLNTQEENRGSQRLYTRFGFKPTGYELPLWYMELD